MPEPTYEQLIAFASGDLAQEQIESVAASVRTDAKAAAIVNAWRAIHRLAASDDSVAPPAAVVSAAKAIFVARQGLPSIGAAIGNWIGAVDRMIARMVYDSRLQPAMVRHSAVDDLITLTFATDDGEIDVQAERAASGKSWRVMGQISESPAGVRDVALVASGSLQVAGSIRSDSRGGFTLDVPPGEYELLVRRGDAVIVLAPLSLP